MSCYEPLNGFIIGLTDEKRNKLLVTSGKVKALDYRTKEPIYHEVPADQTDVQRPAFQLPCGHCLGCREDQSREWSNRLLMESMYHDSVYFVTLTYDDDHIPIVEWLDEETGEYFLHSNLRKRDFQLFIKRLRRAFPDDNIRYYIAGEYGESTDRAHGHAIIYGLHLYDLQPCGRSETGNQYFTSKALSDVWKNGFVSVEPANEFTYKYVASYVTKKLGVHPNAAYEEKGLQAPFSLQSLKPGIGYQYLMDHKEEILKYDRIVLGNSSGSYQFKPPRYWYKKLEEYNFIDPEYYESEKIRRLYDAIDRNDTELARTDLDSMEYLAVKRRQHESKIKKRDGV